MTLIEKAQKLIEESPMLVISGGIAFELAKAYIKLHETLEWYANEDNHLRLVIQDAYQYDVGSRAREVLKEIK